MAALKSLFTKEYAVFMQYLVSARKNAGLTQQRLAQKLGRPQSFVSKYERRERRIDIIEFIIIARSIGFDPCRVIKDVEARLNAQVRQEES